jgi:hypothetical protein
MPGFVWLGWLGWPTSGDASLRMGVDWFDLRAVLYGLGEGAGVAWRQARCSRGSVRERGFTDSTSFNI